MIKVITGIRRCGKSYLLNNLFYHHLLESGVDADHIIRFAFDSADGECNLLRTPHAWLQHRCRCNTDCRARLRR